MALAHGGHHASPVPETSPFATKPTLLGELTTLRPFRDEDHDAMAEAIADPEVLRLTGSVHSTAEAAGRRPVVDEALRRWYSSRNDQTDRLDLAVVDNATGRCVGEVVLNEWTPADASCGFRILIGPRGRDRGLGTEATRLVLDHGFTALGLRRISLQVYVFNPRAQHVYERAGFTVDGITREALRFDDRWVDAVNMSARRPGP